MDGNLNPFAKSRKPSGVRRAGRSEASGGRLAKKQKPRLGRGFRKRQSVSVYLVAGAFASVVVDFLLFEDLLWCL
jgi:hypothetical protein